MFYRLKKNTHVRVSNGHGYITNTALNKRDEVDESGSVFLNALSNEPHTLEQLTDKLLTVFKGVDRKTIMTDACEFYDNLVTNGFLVKGDVETDLFDYDEKVDWRLPINENTINFFLPGLTLDFLGFYVYFANYIQNHPDRFMPNIRLEAFYGSFNNAIWQGGRTMIGIQPSPIDVETAIQRINDLGIAVRYTYTNNVIEERHLSDIYCNMTMELANNGKNEVLVNSPILERYLRKQYPNFKYILSTTSCERNIDKINEATKKYDLVVIDFRDNRNLEFLEKIQDKDKIEILADELCSSKCSFRKKHYDIISKISTLQGNRTEDFCLMKNNTNNKGYFFYKNLEQNIDTNLTCSDIYGTYFDMGFRNIKLIGRNIDPLFTFESYMYYLCKPEWRDRVRDELIGYYVDYIIKYYGGHKQVALDQPVKI